MLLCSPPRSKTQASGKCKTHSEYPKQVSWRSKSANHAVNKKIATVLLDGDPSVCTVNSEYIKWGMVDFPKRPLLVNVPTALADAC
jgi:hypothetical protein